MISEIKKNLLGLKKARYFLFHLVSWDIRFKFRGSKIGFLWTILQPLLLTLIIATVFGFVFDQEMKEYAPYILSGLLVWDFILAAIVGNSYCLISAETYVKQYSHPIILYPLRATLTSVVTFLVAFVAFFVWILFLYPQNIIVGIISLPLTIMIFGILSWSCSIISSHVHIRYRDYPYVMNLLMQVFWYFSPVFFRDEMFKQNDVLYSVFLFNPITQILNLIREPFFAGRFAELQTYLYVLCLMLVVVMMAYYTNKKCEKNVIFFY